MAAIAPKEYSTREEILALGSIDPQFAEFKATNPIPKTPWDQPKLLRTLREERTQKIFESLNNPGCVINLPMRDGYQSPVRVYKPEKPQPSEPVIVLMFGGGFVAGDNRQLATYALQLNAIYGATVFLLSYRLAPENPFPIAQNDVWDSLLWLTKDENASSHGIDTSSGFVLGGVSAGANLAATLGQHWLDTRMDESTKFPLKSLWLSIPAIFFDGSDVPAEYRDVFLSREQNADADIIDERALRLVTLHQKPDRKSPLFSPLNSANPRGHASFAEKRVRVYFQIAGLDPLRDDGLIYERILRRNGVETRLDVYPGVPHAHFGYLPFLNESKRSSEDTVRQFSWLLRRSQ